MADSEDSKDRVETTEQYIKDVRSIGSGNNEPARTPEDAKEIEQNDHVQEENKKSQMNAELDSKFGDCSEPQKSKIKKAGASETEAVSKTDTPKPD